MKFHVYYFDWDWNVQRETFDFEHDAFEFIRLNPDCMYVYHVAKEIIE